MKKLFLLFIILLFAASCKTTALKKYDLAIEKTAISQNVINKKETEIQDKGRAFIYGAGYALSFETNSTPAIRTTEKFIDLAQLSLGQASLQDAKKIREITDGLMTEYKLEISLLEKENAITKEQLKKADTDIKKHQKEIKEAELKLQSFNSNVILLETEKNALQLIHEQNLKELEKLNKENAALAQKYQESDGWLAKLNPFRHVKALFTSLFWWGLILGGIFILLKVAEIFFPALNILGTVFGVFFKAVSKIIPATAKSAGFVGKAAWKTTKNLVLAIENSLNKLEKEDIESELIEYYPETYQFTKKEVKELLEKLSSKIENILKTELKQHNDSESQTVIREAKIETNIKQEQKSVNL